MESDAEIIHAVLRGDRGQFATLVARYERAVWATAWRVVKDDHAASDAAQEAFLEAFKHLSDVRDPDHFGLWLLQIARRQAIRLAKRRSRDPSQSLDDGDSTYADDAFESNLDKVTSLSADAEDLLATVAQLPEHERIVMVMRYLDGRSVAEIAAALGRPVGTITKQISRAIERLKFSLKGVI